MNWIDLRSDTVSQPTPQMRDAMANAPVGDDVYGEDPTINELQAEAAALLGKEAALYVSSGTMSNLTAVLAHCNRGDEIILAKQSHIFQYEAGGVSMYGGVHPNTLDINRDGTIDIEQIQRAIRPSNPHMPITRLVCLENTQAGAWGAPLPKSYVDQVANVAHENNLKLHIDGARLFNAVTALGTPAHELVEHADSISICLSKGLCAPVGSVLVGSHEFIERAHRVRKSLGGGMRQAGIIAAAGLISLREMTKRLHEDHTTARQIAEGLATIPYINIDLERVKSNMIFFTLAADAPISTAELSQGLKARGILANPYNDADRLFRMVTHYWIKPEHVDTVVNAYRALLTGEVTSLSAD